MALLGRKVIVREGRHAGKVGTVTKVSGGRITEVMTIDGEKVSVAEVLVKFVSFITWLIKLIQSFKKQ